MSKGDLRLRHPAGFLINPDVLQEFERGLDPRHPEHSVIPARILGYGEISTVFAIEAEGLRGLAFKRLPIFRTPAEAARYQVIYDEYNRLLTDEVGLRLPPHGYATFVTPAGRPIFYIIQQQLPAESIGNQTLRVLQPADVLILFRRILQELRRVWDFNRRQDQMQVAIDGQLSNWAIAGFDPQRPQLDESLSLLYVDTSTPLFRIQGVEQLDPELFLRSGPSFLVWLLRLLFLKDVVNRYYDFHRVIVDCIANFYKEQRPDLIPPLIGAANEFLAGADLDVPPVTEQEIRSYYREDALIWTLYLSMRKTDRWLRTRVLRGEYPYILPAKIER